MSWSMAWACDRPAGCPTRRSSRPLGRGVRVLRGSVDAELLSRVADEAVEAFAVLSVDALRELGVDVEGHLAVGVADLAHHPLDVEVVGEQGNRDVGAPQRVGGCAWQRREAALDSPGAGCRSGVVDELADALAADAPAAPVWKRKRIGGSRLARTAQAVEVLDERLDQVRGHLHLAHTGRGLRGADVQTRTVAVVKAHITHPQLTQLADAQAAAGQQLDRRPAANIGRATRAQSCEVKADRRLRQAQLGRDLTERAAAGGSSRDLGARRLAA